MRASSVEGVSVGVKTALSVGNRVQDLVGEAGFEPATT